MRYAVALLVAMAMSTAADGAIIIGRIHRPRTVAVSKSVVVSQVGVTRVRSSCAVGICGVR